MGKNRPGKEGEIPRRKRDHLDIVLNREVGFKDKRSGFEEVDFIHNALPELDYYEIDCSTYFLGKKISSPLLISCMTGGFRDGEDINIEIARICNALKLAFGVGSQRGLLENKNLLNLYKGLRDAASSIPLLANIGATEVALLAKGEYNLSDYQRLIDAIDADALVIHLNPLQEMIQPEGNVNFRGVLKSLEILVDGLSRPVVVKEVGAGLSYDVVRRLISAGITYVDIAGAGGTSWSAVEMIRSDKIEEVSPFREWGIPARVALQMALEARKESPELHITASGGIYDGVTAAKAVAMGADLVGSARIMMQKFLSGGGEQLQHFIENWIEEFKTAMFLTGSPSIKELQKIRLLESR